MKRTQVRLCLALLSCTLPACSRRAEAPEQSPLPAGAPVAAASPAITAEAKAIYAQRCTMCHGPDGRGDGPAAANLTPHPRNYTDPEWQKKTSDLHIANIIVGGGPSVNMSAMMPANPDLKQRPDVVAELVKIVRSFAQQ